MKKPIFKVHFYHVDEFLEELSKDVSKIDRKIVRTTYRQKSSSITPNIKQLSVSAGTVIDGYLIELNVVVGELWGHRSEHEDAVMTKADEILKRVEAFCVDHGLGVRAGSFDISQLKESA